MGRVKPQICIRKALMHIRLTRSKRLYYCSLNLLGTNAKTEKLCLKSEITYSSKNREKEIVEKISIPF